MYYYFIENKTSTIKDYVYYDSISISEGLNSLPTSTITVPIKYNSMISVKTYFTLYQEGTSGSQSSTIFKGIITHKTLDKTAETLSLEVSHVIDEWYHEQVPTNLSIKDYVLSDAYNKFNLAGVDYQVEFNDNVGRRHIDYVFSRNNKSDVPSIITGLFQDVYWRIDPASETLSFGTFGHDSGYIINSYFSDDTFVKLTSEPSFDMELFDIVNHLTVYSEKSDGGATSMSLREVYNYDWLQYDTFPVVLTGNSVNTERTYTNYEAPKLASNNGLEYEIIDTEGVALVGGDIYTGTIAFTDLQPFPDTDEKVTDNDRLLASQTAYERACKYLRQKRPRYNVSCEVLAKPNAFLPGDRIKFRYENSITEMLPCDTNYSKKILSENDDWYIISKTTTLNGGDDLATVSLTLNKYLVTDDGSI